MRYLFASLVLSLLLCASASLPAAAKSGDRARESWSDGEGSQQTRPHRQRLARASIADSYDSDDEARPRRRSYRHDGGSRPRIAKHRHARVAKHMRRHQRTARKPGIEPQQGRAAPPAAGRRRRLPPYRSRRRRRQPPTRASAPSSHRPVGGLHGMASYYWEPQALASGGRFNPNALTAAHKTLPFGTRVRVTHMGNGRSVEVKINDRGPYVAGRIIDLSKAAASVIGMTGQGVARVVVEVLGK